MIDKLLEDVEKLAAEEMNRANLVHPLFHSRHEGVAVIEEEVEECKEDMKAILSTHRWAKTCVYDDAVSGADETIKKLQHHALELAAEAIQVAAMCKKWEDSFVDK